MREGKEDPQGTFFKAVKSQDRRLRVESHLRGHRPIGAPRVRLSPQSAFFEPSRERARLLAD